MVQAETTPFDCKPVFDAQRAQNYDERVPKRIPGYGVLHTATRTLLSTSLPRHARMLAVGTRTGSELIAYAQEQANWTQPPLRRCIERRSTVSLVQAIS